jgi:hypothetical protein
MQHIVVTSGIWLTPSYTFRDVSRGIAQSTGWKTRVRITNPTSKLTPQLTKAPIQQEENSFPGEQNNQNMKLTAHLGVIPKDDDGVVWITTRDRRLPVNTK